MNCNSTDVSAAQSSPRRRVKERLASRKTVFGVNPEFASSELVEFVARCGAELIFIDCEHGGADSERVADLARAARVAGAASVLRPWSKDPGLLRRYLGCGIDGFIVPQFESADEARAIWDVIEEVSPEDSENLLVIALIESKQGYANLDAILASSIDAVLTGPGDLGVSLGLPRRGDHVQVREIVFDILRRAALAGKSVGAPVSRYGVDPTVAAGGNLVMHFMRDVIRDSLRAEMRSLELPSSGHPPLLPRVNSNTSNQ